MQLFVRDKQFYKTTVKIAVPIVLQSMITIGVNMMDTFMVGKLGEVQLSATSLANEFINIFHIMCMGMGYGAAVLTAQYWGGKGYSVVKKGDGDYASDLSGAGDAVYGADPGGSRLDHAALYKRYGDYCRG